MKLIFLDVDGVLNCDTTTARVNGYIGVDPEKVSLLKKIVDRTGGKLVLTSTWRRDIDVGVPYEGQTNVFAIELIGKLKAAGLRLYDITSTEKNDSHRKEQILERLHEYRKNGSQIDAWIVIDDDEFIGFDEPSFASHVLNTTYVNGLTEYYVEQAVEMLNGQQEG